VAKDRGGPLGVQTVQELEDSYGVTISDEQAADILTVGQAVDFVLASGATTSARSPTPSTGTDPE
jgi:hypothetical protein